MSTPTFEEALTQLEQRVRELEAGTLPLDDALRVFEDGTKLVRVCEKKLSEVRGKVEVLLKNANGDVAKEAFVE